MSLKFQNDKIYMMPVFFGPSSLSNKPATDSSPAKDMNDYFQPGDIQVVSVTYETDREVLESMIPECYTLNDPYVNVSVCEFTNLGWLSGRTYNLINVNCPVHFKGERDDLDGDLVLVMFENLADPIIGGRELMGYSKIYCDIPEIRHDENKYYATASDWDFQFMRMEIDISKPIPDKETFLANEARSAGKMQYKYIPDVMEKGEDPETNFTKAAVEYPTILPKWIKPDDYPYTIREPQTEYCDGKIEFIAPKSWDEWPSYYGVGLGLNALKVKRIIGAKHCLYNDPCYYVPCYKLR